MPHLRFETNTDKLNARLTRLRSLQNGYLYAPALQEYIDTRQRIIEEIGLLLLNGGDEEYAESLLHEVNENDAVTLTEVDTDILALS